MSYRMANFLDWGLRDIDFGIFCFIYFDKSRYSGINRLRAVILYKNKLINVILRNVSLSKCGGLTTQLG